MIWYTCQEVVDISEGISEEQIACLFALLYDWLNFRRINANYAAEKLRYARPYQNRWI